MLVEFRVKNYRSIKDEAVLSFAASSDKSLSLTNTQNQAAEGLPAILRSAVIYGANASGKSNFVRALSLMRSMVIESANLQPNQPINVQPFVLDKGTAIAPTLFEVTVALNGIRYQYGFEFTPSKIVSEWLLVYKAPKPQVWFDRRTDRNEASPIQFGSNFTGPKKVWENATRPNALFLSTAIQLNSDKLRPLYDWFANALCVFLDGGHIPDVFTTNMIHSGAGQSKIVNLMSAADIAISAISTQPMKALTQQFSWDLMTGQTNTQAEELEMFRPRFKHEAGDVSVEFDLQDESQGTQKLYSLAGPLLDILDKGYMMVVDELDRSLHPILVRKIIEAFQDPTVNRNGSQLLFTTHDTSLLDHSLLRRDQIWFAEKRTDQSSELVPLSEFSPRKGEALERNYLSGRYGGVPILAPKLLEGSRLVTH